MAGTPKSACPRLARGATDTLGPHPRQGRTDPERARSVAHDPEPKTAEGAVRLSTHNQLPGTVTSIRYGEAMAVVKVTLDGGQGITSSITREAAEDLALAEGSAFTVLIKSTEVMLAAE
jgi:molybdate transport system regulatory protein